MSYVFGGVSNTEARVIEKLAGTDPKGAVKKYKLRKGKYRDDCTYWVVVSDLEDMQNRDYPSTQGNLTGDKEKAFLATMKPIKV
jgi:hypothetical protein